MMHFKSIEKSLFVALGNSANEKTSETIISFQDI